MYTTEVRWLIAVERQNKKKKKNKKNKNKKSKTSEEMENNHFRYYGSLSKEPLAIAGAQYFTACPVAQPTVSIEHCARRQYKK